MKIYLINAKSILTKSGLPESDYVINPYIGCMHGCVYCYARFMKRYTTYKEPWGNFVGVKLNAFELLPNTPLRNKSVTISSVTDPYQPIEAKYKITRRVLEHLVKLQPKLCVMTKSGLVLRDTELLKGFKDCIAGVSMSVLDKTLQRSLEPRAASPEKRIRAVKLLKSAGLRTFVFISPILPGLTQWQDIVNRAGNYVDEIWFENLNITNVNWQSIRVWLQSNQPELLGLYEKIYTSDKDYWARIEQEIARYSKRAKPRIKLYFHHKRVSQKRSALNQRQHGSRQTQV